MKVLLVARKSLIEIWREPQLLGLVFGLPLVFLLITWLMYNTPILVTYRLMVFDPAGKALRLVELLRGQRYENGDPIFEVMPVENLEAAETALIERRANLLVKFNPDGSQAVLRGDALSSAFYRVSVMVETTMRLLANQEAGRPQIIRLVTENIIASSYQSNTRQTQFELYAPGMIAFALLMIIPQTAMLVSREVRRHTIDRLQIAACTTSEFLGGICLAQMAVAACQVATITLLASAMGFDSRGPLWLAVLVGIALSLGSIALGLIVSAFVENDSQAANLGASVSMLLVFLSGAWFTMPSLTLFSIAGHPIGLFDFFPATSGFTALQQVLLFGAGFQEIIFRLGMTLLLSGIFFLIAVALFQKIRIKHA